MRNRGHRVVFMGSPAFSLPILRMLAAEFFVVGVVTQPDRPKGRGKKMLAPPVKEMAEQLEIPVIQPARLRKDAAAKAALTAWQPDVIVVAAFGQLLKSDILSLPEFGCVNVHTSLLPRWRGASPIESAILAGDQVTGTTIMLMDEGMDTGPILKQAALAIQPEWRSSELELELSQQGAQLLQETLPLYLNGVITPTPQPSEGVTHAPLINKGDGVLDVQQSLTENLRKIRAYYPWPGTSFVFNEQLIKIVSASAHPDSSAIPGVRSIINHLPAIGCVGGWILCDELQPSGKTVMAGNVFLRGYQQRWLEVNDH